MGISAATALIIGAVVSGIGTVVQFASQRSAQKKADKRHREAQAAQARAEAAQQQAADLQARRRRIQLVREARIARARTIQLGVNSGLGGGSTAITGSVGALRTDLASTISFLDQTRALNNLARKEFGLANSIASTPIKVSGVGSLISTAGGLLFGAAQSGLFGGSTSTVPTTTNGPVNGPVKFSSQPGV